MTTRYKTSSLDKPRGQTWVGYYTRKTKTKREKQNSEETKYKKQKLQNYD